MTIINSGQLGKRWGWVFGLFIAALIITGCKSDSTSQFAELPGGAPAPDAAAAGGAPGDAAAYGSGVIHAGEAMQVTFSDLPVPMNPFEVRVKEDGTITLPFNETFSAVGKTTGELEKEVRVKYVPKYYVNLTVTIRQQDQFYYVGGEVKSPNRFPYAGPTTVIKAIQSAGDFTDFAKKQKVQLTRPDGSKATIDCVKAQENPRLDLPVFPGDKIHVYRRLL